MFISTTVWVELLFVSLLNNLKIRMCVPVGNCFTKTLNGLQLILKHSYCFNGIFRFIVSLPVIFINYGCFSSRALWSWKKTCNTIVFCYTYVFIWFCICLLYSCSNSFSLINLVQPFFSSENVLNHSRFLLQLVLVLHLMSYLLLLFLAKIGLVDDKMLKISLDIQLFLYFINFST